MIFPKRICLRWDWKNRKRIPLETLLQKWYQWTKQNRFRDSENKLMAVSREQCGRDSYEDWDLCVQTTSFKVSNQQGPTVQHGKLCAVLCGRMNGKGVWGEWIRVSMTGSLCCPPETTTTLLMTVPSFSVTSVMSSSLRTMDYSPPVSSVHCIIHSRILGWVAMSPGNLPNPGMNTFLLSLLPCRWILYHWATGDTH